MINKKAYTLIDAMIALLISGIAIAAISSLINTGSKGLFLHNEQLKGWEILGHTSSLPGQWLVNHHIREFDALGLPGGNKYRLEIEKEELGQELILNFSVTWSSDNNQTYTIFSQRVIWRSEDESI